MPEHPHYGKPLMKVLTALAVLTIALGAFFIVGPAGRIPLMDANRTMLAESEAQGFCAATAHFNNLGQEDFDTCVDESVRSSAYNLPKVVPAFCRGVLDAGWDGTHFDCVEIVKANRLWPTAEPTRTGWISDSFNRSFPYPGDTVGIGQSRNDSRTGERDDNIRDGNERGE